MAVVQIKRKKLGFDWPTINAKSEPAHVIPLVSVPPRIRVNSRMLSPSIPPLPYPNRRQDACPRARGGPRGGYTLSYFVPAAVVPTTFTIH